MNFSKQKLCRSGHRERAPLDWAETQNNLGGALRVLGERGDDDALRRAVAAYEAALEERTRSAPRSTGRRRRAISAPRSGCSASAAMTRRCAAPLPPLRRRSVRYLGAMHQHMSPRSNVIWRVLGIGFPEPPRGRPNRRRLAHTRF
jgi:hypothetical protein